MKLTKSLFMLCAAGLSLCACNSDENVNQLPDGVGMVEVKVYSPETKAVTTGSSDGTIEVTGDITVTLYADFMDSTGSSRTATEKSVVLNAGNNTAKFWNVKNPTRVTASVNGGTDTYASTAINDATMQVAPASIPAYGEATPSLSNNSQSPILGGDADEKVNANEGDNKKTYQVYTASIAMKIPVARLEVSGLKISSTTDYSSLTLDGVYLDHISVNGPSWSVDGFKNFASNPQDYVYEEGKGIGNVAILKDPAKLEGGTPKTVDFATYTANTLPESGVYAYNFYGAPEGTATSDDNAATYNPSFKMYFSTGTYTGANPVIYPRFAFIKKFKDTEGNTIVLQNGNVYRIIAAELSDENIIGDEGGNTLYGVDVTVQKASWTVQTIKADWAQ